MSVSLKGDHEGDLGQIRHCVSVCWCAFIHVTLYLLSYRAHHLMLFSYFLRKLYSTYIVAIHTYYYSTKMNRLLFNIIFLRNVHINDSQKRAEPRTGVCLISFTCVT